MKPELDKAINEGADRCWRRMLTVEAYIAQLRAKGSWTDKELRQIEIAVRIIIDDPPRRHPRRYQRSDN